MCKKIPILLLLFCLSAPAYSQDTTANDLSFDTSAVLNDLMLLLDSANAPVSYGLVSAGMGNRIFSVRNNRLNARQSNTSSLVFNPSLGYFHKSGLSITAGASLLNQAKKGFGPTQYTLTPAYDFNSGKNWSFGLSYSRYFAVDKYSVYASPVQNDIYAYLNYKKWWIEPGITAGYSNGRYKEINSFTVQSTGNTYIDTGTYNLKTFSLSINASHDFEWDKIFGKKDALSFTPSLLLNMGSDSTEVVSHTLFPNLLRFLKRRNRLPRLAGKNSFEAQSLALSLDLSYNIGSFTVLPQLYLDYYLPATEEKRLTQTFTLSVGYSF